MALRMVTSDDASARSVERLSRSSPAPSARDDASDAARDDLSG
jgi:hypothetical protein